MSIQRVLTSTNSTAGSQVFGIRREPAGSKLLCTDCFIQGLAPDGLVVALFSVNHTDLVASDGQLRGSFDQAHIVGWSPDGAHTVVVTQAGRVFVLDSDASEPLELPIERPLYLDGFAAVWSPDSQFLAIKTKTSVAIWGPSGGASELVELPTFGGTPFWAPDSRRLAIAGTDPDGTDLGDRIDFVDRDDASTSTVRARDLLPFATGPMFSVFGWSVDSQHFAFEVHRNGDTEEPDRFRIVNAHGEVEAAYPGDSSIRMGGWSPRANVLALESVGASRSLYLWSPERSSTVPLPAPLFELAWSPDGSRILASHQQATEGVAASVIDVAAERIVSTLPDHWLAEWSPDGTHLAFRSAMRLPPDETPVDLLISDANGENRVVAVQDVWNCIWMRDSRYLLAADPDEIFTVRFDGEDRQKVLAHDDSSRISFGRRP